MVLPPLIAAAAFPAAFSMPAAAAMLMLSFLLDFHLPHYYHITLFVLIRHYVSLPDFAITLMIDVILLPDAFRFFIFRCFGFRYAAVAVIIFAAAIGFIRQIHAAADAAFALIFAFR